MPNVLAFFPWLRTDQAFEVAGVRLTPFRRSHLPGDSGTALQSDMDAILAAYSRRKNALIDRATLLELTAWSRGQDASPDVVSELFRIRELLAFCGLAHRQLFRGRDYTNFDTFALTIQRYAATSAGTFSFDVRRRDGGTSHLWDTEEFAFLKPLHVEDGARLHFDPALFEALRRADSDGNAPFDAIVEYNRANTDSQDVPIHTELVMMRSALEYFLKVDYRDDNLVRALTPMIEAFVETESFPCPDFARWRARFPKSQRLIEAWAREFCVQRNEAGHGAERGRDIHVWSQHSHLAFASMLLPMLVKSQLASRGYFAPSESEQIHHQWIEAYLGVDPFTPVPELQRDRPIEHEWSRIYSDGVVGEKIRRGIRAEFRRIMPDESDA